MDKLKDILWPIVLIGGLGGLIDFLIGKAGQAKAKDFLLKWWVRFDDVRWSNFGREEGLFAAHLIERWFGKRTWSSRRVKAFVLLFLSIYILLALAKSLGLLAESVEGVPISELDSTFHACHLCQLRIPYSALIVIMYFVGFSLSFSFTKFITLRMAHLCGGSGAKNLILFVTMLFLTWMMIIWPGIAIYFREVITVWIAGGDWRSFVDAAMAQVQNPDTDAILLKFRENPQIFFALDTYTFIYCSFFPTFFRLALVMVFVGSFLVKPLVMRPVSLVWARIVESEKPVFTLMFGGAAAFATAIGEAAKHL